MDTPEIDSMQKNDRLLSVEIGLLSEELERLQSIAQMNPSLRVCDILLPNPNSQEAQVRELAISVFLRVGNIVGRNSRDATFADAKIRLLEAHQNGRIPEYSSYRGRRKSFTGTLQDWILKYVSPYLDADMRTTVMFDIRLYRGILKKLYENMKLWRQRNTEGSANVFK